MKKIIRRSILTAVLPAVLAACQPVPPPAADEYITEYEKTVLSREIKRRAVQTPASIERIDNGFIIRELDSGKVYRVKIRTKQEGA